jgi:hypothetical protein
MRGAPVVRFVCGLTDVVVYELEPGAIAQRNRVPWQ